ncbi:MAG: hypothetical protein KKB95_12875 [Gammaproteobacteria bacterium]|nr:hypothetical protein [Gammaproteobacteria bacterium]MBU1505564.1 hypothetical protein [Gammaproteobacteria bacterium]MBU2120308.1 hypothetical protein [Gammaproteobacteria bacterium]MBU2170796.1 hypothetical protein [Gammaproteobacteria bacterium]MBU2200811.1 hypothetical protein [Gammaproteobacteria bacterium]
MIALVATTVRFLLRHLMGFVLICAVLLFGKWAWAEWQAHQSTQAELAQLTAVDKHIARELNTLTSESQDRVAKFASASLDALTARINAIDQETRSKQLDRQKASAIGPVLKGQPIVAHQWDGMRLDAEIYLLNAERQHLEELRLRLQATQSAQARRAELERLRLVHQGLYTQWQAAKREREAMEQAHPVACRLGISGIGSAEYQQCEQLRGLQAQLQAENRRAAEDYQRQNALAQAIQPLPPLAAFAPRQGNIDALLAPLRDRKASLQDQRAGNWFSRLSQPLQDVLPTALFILLSAIFAPLGIKALFYFVLAPLAARRPPVRLLPDSLGEVALESHLSAVSREVTVDAAHELLLHPDFLQSASIAGQTDTCWLLNRRFPLTSLASGMVALTRIRTTAPATYVVSATQDAHSEIGVLVLPTGAALVMQPHNLVGVLQQRGEPVRITSHWRLGSLHAWLTLQLRYLAFHGPAQLIVQGCRGVRVEPAATGRSVSQAATIAFNANLGYSTRRCETFIAYVRGKQALLNDSFQGDKGFYVYEEMPHSSQRDRGPARWLQGLADSVLKVFGI